MAKTSTSSRLQAAFSASASGASTNGAVSDDEGMKVLALGQSRTGTVSLKAAFNKLGFGPSYHMAEVVSKSTAIKDVKEWQKAFRNEPADIRGLLRGYKSTLDYPCNELYEQLLTMYPDAKVILQTRDPASCAKSVDESIGTWHFPSKWNQAWWGAIPCIRYQRELVERWARMTQMNDGTHRIDHGLIERWNEKIKARVPPEKLLVWDIEEGYAPLCKFLDVPVPDEPFPRSNDTKQMLMVIRAITRACHFITFCWIFGATAGPYLTYTYMRYGDSSYITAWTRNVAISLLGMAFILGYGLLWPLRSSYLSWLLGVNSGSTFSLSYSDWWLCTRERHWCFSTGKCKRDACVNSIGSKYLRRSQ